MVHCCPRPVDGSGGGATRVSEYTDSESANASITDENDSLALTVSDAEFAAYGDHEKVIRPVHIRHLKSFTTLSAENLLETFKESPPARPALEELAHNNPVKTPGKTTPIFIRNVFADYRPVKPAFPDYHFPINANSNYKAQSLPATPKGKVQEVDPGPAEGPQTPRKSLRRMKSFVSLSLTPPVPAPVTPKRCFTQPPFTTPKREVPQLDPEREPVEGTPTPKSLRRMKSFVGLHSRALAQSPERSENAGF
ncbi:hypothetical protein RUND412_009305 [Rhizina undulata]